MKILLPAIQELLALYCTQWKTAGGKEKKQQLMAQAKSILDSASLDSRTVLEKLPFATSQGGAVLFFLAPPTRRKLYFPFQMLKGHSFFFFFISGRLQTEG